jgi:hypothetical protein
MRRGGSGRRAPSAGLWPLDAVVDGPRTAATVEQAIEPLVIAIAHGHDR